MPDGIQPVGALIKPQDPSQGINTMTGILGLRQARLMDAIYESARSGQVVQVVADE